MKVILDYWNRRWQSVEYDTSCGEGRVRWFRRKPKHCMGWAAKHEGNWYALWLDDDYLVFQAGHGRWKMTDVLQCRNIRHDTRRIFTVDQNGSTVFKMAYKPPFNQDGLDIDEMDFETVDFFYWVSRVCRGAGLKESLKIAWDNNKQNQTRVGPRNK